MCRSKAEGGRRCLTHLEEEVEKLTKEIQGRAGEVLLVREDPAEPNRAAFNSAQRAYFANPVANEDGLTRTMASITDEEAATYQSELASNPHYERSFTRLLLRTRARRAELQARKYAKAADEEAKAKREEEERVKYIYADDEGQKEWRYKPSLAVTITDDERELLLSQAQAEGKSLGQLLRDRISAPSAVRAERTADAEDLSRDETGESISSNRAPSKGIKETEEGKVNNTRKPFKFAALDPEVSRELTIRANVFRNSVSDQIRYEALGIDPRITEAHRSAGKFTKRVVQKNEDGTETVTHVTTFGSAKFRRDYFEAVERDVPAEDIPALYERLIAEERSKWERKSDHELAA